MGLFIGWFFRYDLSVDIIAAFDLMEKKLLEIRLPDDYDTIHTSCGLWAFGEFLSRWGYNDDKVEI